MKKWLLLVVSVMFLLAGCNSKEANGSNKTTLTVWWWGDQEAPGAKKWMEETVTKFQEKNPNIKVKTVLQSTDQLIPAFKSAAASQQGPDIQYFWGGIYTLEEAWQGNIVPMSDYISKDELSHYINSDERKYDGKVWGASWYLSDNSLAYRKDVFQKAGLDPANPPKTWEEFLVACEKIKKAGYTPLAAGVKDGWLGGWMWQLLGKQTLDDKKDLLKVAVGKADFSDTKYSEWLNKLAELKEKGYINTDSTSLDYQQGQEQFLQGKAGMIFGNDTFYPNWVKQAGEDKIGVAAVPAYGKGKMADTITVTAQGMGITSWSEHKKEAAEFIKFMHTKERLDAWYQDTGVFPADDRFDASQIKLPQMKQMFEMVKEKPSINLENFAPSVLEEQAIFPGVQMILSGEKKPEQVAKEGQQALERWRKENPDALDNFKNWLNK